MRRIDPLILNRCPQPTRLTLVVVAFRPFLCSTNQAPGAAAARRHLGAGREGGRLWKELCVTLSRQGGTPSGHNEAEVGILQCQGSIVQSATSGKHCAQCNTYHHVLCVDMAWHGVT